MSPSRFFLADGIYALPGVTLLFFLGYWFSGTMVDLINNEMTQVKHILVVVLVLGVAGYLLHRFLRKPVVTGDPQDIPKLTGAFPNAVKQFGEDCPWPVRGSNHTPRKMPGRAHFLCFRQIRAVPLE